jgi:D-arabinose 1-dehydrogenase-like Zn-dependent alcohol dehydrogenase
VIGRRVSFDGIPEALEAMERRETTGRLVVTL